MNDIRVSADALLRFCRACFEKAGLAGSVAQVTADNLVFANLRGVDSHGVIRLKVYVDRLHAGGFNAAAQARVIAEDAATALLDGGGGMGQAAAVAAMDLAIAKAAQSGAGWVSCRNSNHFGAAAFYALRAIDRGMIGFAATNSGPTMAPTGGCEARLGNNAFAIAIPAHPHPPVVLDMATGAVAWGKIFVAQQKKQKIPLTWALDSQGRPTDDPEAAARGGLIQPMAGYKGYGLSLVLDIFTGVLSGGGFATGVRTLYRELDTPSGIAHTCGALRVDRFIPVEAFQQRMAEMIELLRNCPTVPGAERIYVPGEIEDQTAKHRRSAGIPIHSALRQELAALAVELGIPECPPMDAGEGAH
ncbi:MAG TPA: Ldh family oxidoreductase [Verrucomicrobiae bacterium]|nr:Ldh family oxidoreductase [Verrucomicrobiae bacterium]